MTTTNNNFRVKNGLEVTNTATIAQATIGLNNGSRAFGNGYYPANANNMKIENPNAGAGFNFAMKNPSGVEKNVGISRQGNVVLANGSLGNSGSVGAGGGFSATDGGPATVDTSFDDGSTSYKFAQVGGNVTDGAYLFTEYYDYGTDTDTTYQLSLNFQGTATLPGALMFPDNSIQTTAYTGGTTGIPLITAAETTATTTATGKLVSISDTGGMLAYYNDTTSTWLYVGTETPVYAPPDPNAPPISGYIAWYDASSVSLGTNTWTDKTGNGHNGTIYGSPSVVSETGNGATATFNCLSGGTSASVTFPSAILPSTYTLFHVTRYSGSNRGRMLTQPGAYPPYWISGFYNGDSGIAYRAGYVNPSYVSYGTDWVISADQNYFYRPNGNAARSGTSGNGASVTGMILNGYTYESGQLCDWECAEIVVYNRTLTSGEIATMESHFATKYGITIG